MVGVEGVSFLLRSNAACSDDAGARQQRFGGAHFNARRHSQLHGDWKFSRAGGPGQSADGENSVGSAG
jgi:hypothetical protein